jgi:hypothetical protein
MAGQQPLHRKLTERPAFSESYADKVIQGLERAT